jgi:hypothetical protein
MFVRFSETRDLVHRTAHGLTPQQLQYRPDASRWSVAENLEHITIVSIGGRGQVLGSRVTGKVQSLRVEIANTDLS